MYTPACSVLAVSLQCTLHWHSYISLYTPACSVFAVPLKCTLQTHCRFLVNFRGTANTLQNLNISWRYTGKTLQKLCKPDAVYTPACSVFAVYTAIPEPDAVYTVACSVYAVSLQCTLQWYFPFHDTLCHAVYLQYLCSVHCRGTAES